MDTGAVVLFVAVHLILVWLVTKMKKMRYKLLAFFLIALSLFAYFTFGLALDGQEIDLTTAKGVGHAFGIYFSWLGSAFGNAQEITSRVVENNSSSYLDGK